MRRLAVCLGATAVVLLLAATGCDDEVETETRGCEQSVTLKFALNADVHSEKETLITYPRVPIDFQVFAGGTTPESGFQLTIEPPGNGAVSPGASSTRVITPERPGTYSIVATRGTCRAVTNLVVRTDCNNVQLALAAAGGQEAIPLGDFVELSPRVEMQLEVSSPDPFTLVGLRLANPTPGQYVLVGAPQTTDKGDQLRFISTTPSGAVRCVRYVDVVTRTGCSVSSPSFGATNTPFGSAVSTIAPGAVVPLSVAMLAPGTDVTFVGQSGAIVEQTSPTTAAFHATPFVESPDVRQRVLARVRKGETLACYTEQEFGFTADRVGLLKEGFPGLRLAVANGKVHGIADGTIGRINLDGTGFELLATDEGVTDGVAALGNTVYWMSQKASTTLRSATAPATAQTVATLAEGAGPMAPEPTGSAIFFSELDAGDFSVIRRRKLPGGETTVVGTPDAPLSMLVPYGNFLFWSKRIPVGASAMVARADVTNPGNPPVTIFEQSDLPVGDNLGPSLAVDATHVYALFSQSLDPGAGQIFRRNFDGSGAIAKVVDAVGAVSIAVDATHVYWVTGPAPATVRRIRKDLVGGVQDVATALGHAGRAITLDGNYVYFSADDQLHRAHKP